MRKQKRWVTLTLTHLRAVVPSGKTPATPSIPPRKNIPLYRNSELRHITKQPGPSKRGVSFVVRNVGRVAVDAAASARGARAGRVVPVSPRPRANERSCQVRLASILSARVHTAEGPCGVDERAYGKTVWSRPSSLRPSFCGGVERPTGSTTSSIRGAREARRNSAPGRARHKPSNHCAGKAVCSAPPVCRCALLIALHAHSGPWVRGQHPAFPAPSV